MDVSVREELSDLIEKMTHSGSPSLDEAQLKKLKKLCRSSDIYVRATYDLVMSNLAKKHAEVRLSAFQIVAELFPRSHLFRQLVVSDFQRLAELVTGTESRHPLPPPRPAATRLKESSLLAIRQWNDKFGEGYPKLKLGFNHLKHNKKVDFDRLVAQTEAVRRRSVARDARREAIAQQQLNQVHTEMADQKYDIASCLKEMESCFNLLLPRFDMMEDTFLSTEQHSTPPNELLPLIHSGREGESRVRTISSSSSFVSLGSTGNSDSDNELDKEAESESFALKKSGEELAKETINQAASSHECEQGDGGEQGDSGEQGGGGEQGDSGEQGGGGEQGDGGELGEDSVQSASGDHDGGDEQGDSGKQGDGDEQCDGGEQGDDGLQGDGGVNSDDSDVEWEEVELLPMTSMQQNGFVSRGINIPIRLPVKILVEETEDNASILTALSESHHLLEHTYLPTVNKWLEWLTKAGEESDLKEAIDIKSSILAVLHKYKRLNIASSHLERTSHTPRPVTPPPTQSTQLQSIQSPPPTTTTSVLPQTNSSLRSMQQELEQDPTTIHAQLGVLRKRKSSNNTQPSSVAAGPSTSSGRQAPNSAVPIVPFDMDLYHWDNPDGKPVSIKKVCMSSVHQYWGAEKDIEICDEEKALQRCRTIQFTGKFEPVKWSCRAPLPSGKLCPRKDRLKCPFHGPIIARDEQGQPSDTSTAATSFTTNSATTSTTDPLPSSTISEADYDDIEAAVFAAKGIENPQKGKGKKGKRGRQKKHPGLTDLKAQNNTARKRLERQIFSKRTVRKVADAMDAVSARHHHDKFGDTFNYALKN